MNRRSEGVFALLALAAVMGCSSDVAGPDVIPPDGDVFPTANTMLLVDFEGPSMPLNQRGETYPSQYSDGAADVSLGAGGIGGGSAASFRMTSGVFYAQFNPYAGSTRSFARDYSAAPASWQYDTYNRLSFWIKAPPQAMAQRTDGQTNVHFGTYVKRIANADPFSDETGGGHWYHHLNVPNTGVWTRVVINMHPNHLRGSPGGNEHGDQRYPTGEAGRNYFDALTRFYVSQQAVEPTSFPAEFMLDEFVFYEEPNAENDDQVYSITASYEPAAAELRLSWNRDKDENQTDHEVRYAFESVHSIGWDQAQTAPSGVVTPPGWQGYNNMLYVTDQIDLSGRSVVYLAIRPVGATTFSQIALPLP